MTEAVVIAALNRPDVQVRKAVPGLASLVPGWLAGLCARSNRYNRVLVGLYGTFRRWKFRRCKMQELVELVDLMVAESGESKGFDAREWLTRWLDQPCPALGNRRPVQFLMTSEGQRIVSGLLRQMQSGAYA